MTETVCGILLAAGISLPVAGACYAVKGICRKILNAKKEQPSRENEKSQF